MLDEQPGDRPPHEAGEQQPRARGAESRDDPLVDAREQFELALDRALDAGLGPALLHWTVDVACWLHQQGECEQAIERAFKAMAAGIAPIPVCRQSPSRMRPATCVPICAATSAPSRAS